MRCPWYTKFRMDSSKYSWKPKTRQDTRSHEKGLSLRCVYSLCVLRFDACLEEYSHWSHAKWFSELLTIVDHLVCFKSLSHCGRVIALVVCIRPISTMRELESFESLSLCRRIFNCKAFVFFCPFTFWQFDLTCRVLSVKTVCGWLNWKIGVLIFQKKYLLLHLLIFFPKVLAKQVFLTKHKAMKRTKTKTKTKSKILGQTTWIWFGRQNMGT